MRRFLAWRQRQLVKTARRYIAHPWGYSVRWSSGLAIAVFLGSLIGGASAVDAAASGVVAGVLVLPVVRGLLGPYWVRVSRT